MVFRTSASTGFKAPSLHQINLSVNQASFTGGVVQTEGLFSNTSKEARSFGIPNLKAEKSLNFTAGLGVQPNKNFSATLDYYYIRVDDRVLLSSRIPITTNLRPIVPSAVSASFFINGINTATQGFDLVVNWKNIALGAGKLGMNFAGNINHSKIIGESSIAKQIIENVKSKTGETIVPFNRMEEAIATTSRPAYKAVLGLDYSVNKFQFYLNNTLFGTAKWANDGIAGAYSAWNVANEGSLGYLEYQPRVVTDLNVNYNINKSNTLTFSISNLFNVLPKWKLVNVSAADAAPNGSVYNAVTFNGRYPQSAYDSQHFSIFGTQFTLGYNIKF